MEPSATNAAATGKPAETLKIALPRRAYRCGDGGWVSLSGSTDSMVRRVFEAIGKPELIEDPRFSINAARIAHDDEVEAVLCEFIGGMEREAALTLFRRLGVTVGPIHDATSLLRDPHVAARGVHVEEAGSGNVMRAMTRHREGMPGGLRHAGASIRPKSWPSSAPRSRMSPRWRRGRSRSLGKRAKRRHEGCHIRLAMMDMRADPHAAESRRHMRRAPPLGGHFHARAGQALGQQAGQPAQPRASRHPAGGLHFKACPSQRHGQAWLAWSPADG